MERRSVTVLCLNACWRASRRGNRSMNNSQPSFDALLPREMAQRGKHRRLESRDMQAMTMFSLAVLAGAFIALGAVFATTVTSGAGAVSLGGTTGTAGLPFGFPSCWRDWSSAWDSSWSSCGARSCSLYNNLIAIAWAYGKVKTSALLRNWGSSMPGISWAPLVRRSGCFSPSSIRLARTGLASTPAIAPRRNAITTASSRRFVLGILCNALVCLAVWLTFSARSTTDKILSIIFPITAFVAGFEHSVANMYFIPIGLFIKRFDASCGHLRN